MGKEQLLQAVLDLCPKVGSGEEHLWDLEPLVAEQDVTVAGFCREREGALRLLGELVVQGHVAVLLLEALDLAQFMRAEELGPGLWLQQIPDLLLQGQREVITAWLQRKKTQF